MPRKAPLPPDLQTLFQDFEEEIQRWNQYRSILSFLRLPLSKGWVVKLTICCQSIEEICKKIVKLHSKLNMEPDHAKLFPDMKKNKEKVMLEWNELMYGFEKRTEECKTRENWSQTCSSISTTSTTASSLTLVNGVTMGNALLPIQTIPLSNFEADLRVMFDACSQSTFIRNNTAKMLKLKGVLVNYILVCTDGSEKEMKGFIYKLNLRDMSGHHHELEAIGLDKLSTAYTGVKVVNLREVFKENPLCRSLTEAKLERAGGELDLLVGSDLAHLHPKAVAEVGSLSLLKSKFSTGWTMMGHNKDHLILEGKNKGVKVNVCAVKNIKVAEIFDNKRHKRHARYYRKNVKENSGQNAYSRNCHGDLRGRDEGYKKQHCKRKRRRRRKGRKQESKTSESNYVGLYKEKGCGHAKEIKIENVKNDAEDNKMEKNSTNGRFLNPFYIHATDDEDESAEVSKGEESHPAERNVRGLALVVASQEEQEGVDVDDASQGREEKGVEADIDANVDATRLHKIIEVSDDDENQKQEEIPPKSEEFFENDDQSNSSDDQTNENDEHSNENDEVNGNDNQVKTKGFFKPIAIFLMYPFYRYRKKRWKPKTLDL